MKAGCVSSLPTTRVSACARSPPGGGGIKNSQLGIVKCAGREAALCHRRSARDDDDDDDDAADDGAAEEEVEEFQVRRSRMGCAARVPLGDARPENALTFRGFFCSTFFFQHSNSMPRLWMDVRFGCTVSQNVLV